MKKVIQISCVLLSVILLSTACDDETVSTDCIDESLINPDIFCTTDYAPVCGCDNQTYSNECVATSAGGVTSWTQGECP